MEIIKLLGNFHKKGFIYERFLKLVVSICPYLMTSPVVQANPLKEDIEDLAHENKNKLTFLELNASQLGKKLKLKKIEGLAIVSIQNLIEVFLNDDITINEDVISMNLEASIDAILQQ